MKKPITLVFWFGTILLIIVVGIIGFMLTEHYNFLDALYMTVITIATIGYQEVKPLTTNGKIFNIIFIVSSFTIFTYALSRLTRYMVSGELALYLKNRKLMNAMEHISNHVIICGFGRNGQQAAKILRQHKTDFVVIDNDENHFKEWLEDHTSLISILGDATDDEVLIKAGIQKAKALLLTLPTDADNVFIVLSARSLNPHLQIISRAGQKSAVKKLKTAGANHVILPDKIGGAHMATLVSKPDVIEFINNLWGDEADAINIESIDYNMLPDSLKDKSIQDIIYAPKTGVNCIGIKDKEGRFIINPSPDTIIQAHMKIMLLGTMHQMSSMKAYLEKA
ncbi:potassium channel protein [Ilyomonas limi]|uniref:Potassium channel protein n=1 Tax=Ilyomonas limi TaxID=2575867 RepID=A0A4V5UVG7_9BACT|nr:potassium channel protein [Ilyomonas limi]TKK67503.1 potassium channel protein [Ilyomonas limi]